MKTASSKKSQIAYLINIIALVAGILIFMYPTISDTYNQWLQRNAISSYETAVQSMSVDQYRQIRDAAAGYNQDISEHGIKWIMTEDDMDEYFRQIAIGQPVNGTESTPMGYIVIPKINAKYTIYHTTDEPVLNIGIGHMEGTSLPIGGEGTHSTLSGHRGLPTAKLFTDLDKLVIGDTFQINVLSETLTYEVDNILVTNPDDLAPLAIEKGKDLCTLITCTPYGVNTHRLLVRGHRVENELGDVAVPSDAMQYEPVLIAPFFAAPILLLGLVWLMITSSSRGALRRSQERALSEIMDGTGTVVSKAGNEAGGEAERRAGSEAGSKAKAKGRGKGRK